MDRKYIVTVVPQGWNWEESYFRYTLPKFNELIYDSQDDALEAIIGFITFWTKDTNLRNIYFKGKFELSVDHFIISPAPDYRISGFDSKEDINAYTG